MTSGISGKYVSRQATLSACHFFGSGSRAKPSKKGIATQDRPGRGLDLSLSLSYVIAWPRRYRSSACTGALTARSGETAWLFLPGLRGGPPLPEEPPADEVLGPQHVFHLAVPRLEHGPVGRLELVQHPSKLSRDPRRLPTRGDDGEIDELPPLDEEQEVPELHLLQGAILPEPERVLDELLDRREHRAEDVPVLVLHEAAREVVDEDAVLGDEEDLLDPRSAPPVNEEKDRGESGDDGADDVRERRLGLHDGYRHREGLRVPDDGPLAVCEDRFDLVRDRRAGGRILGDSHEEGDCLLLARPEAPEGPVQGRRPRRRHAGRVGEKAQLRA